ncbi:SDR family oxidoreductase [Rhodococcus globerulus]|uniref:SDR family NAD(P)-dependent oxidoreductase n=1 Tax=Rhodococcus globerulus TaxID=33008 RepID=UPI003018AAEE
MSRPASGVLHGRVAIVTGGGRGVGRALSIGLALAGARVVVAGRTERPCLETVEEIRSAGGQAHMVVSDVSRVEGRYRLVEESVATFGAIDILVNNAAVLKPHHTLKVTEGELDEIFATNLKGPVFLSQLAYPYLREGGRGSIINFAALGAFQPLPGIGAYCAVKAALINWTSTMAKEWTPSGVRVNALVPGPVATEMILPTDPVRRAAFEAEMSAATLVGRMAMPEDLVGAVVFLAGDDSSFMTGRSLFMDGGMLA